MKVTKCDRCGKDVNLERRPPWFIKDNFMDYRIPIKLKYDIDKEYINRRAKIDICWDCQVSLQKWFEEFKEGNKDENN